MGRWTGATRVAGWSRPERGTARASPGVFNQDHWVVTVRSYRGLCLCHANRAHGSMCTVLKRNPGKPPGKCPNCARSDLKLFFSEKINLPGFRFQNITCRFFCVCVCLSTWPLFFCQSFSHANIHSWWKTGKITKPLGWKMDITQRMAGVSRCLSRWFAQNPQFYNITWNIVKGIGPLHERVRLGPDTI